MKDRQEFFYWLITICCIGLAVIFAQNAHLWEAMSAKDATKISWLICGIFAATSAVIGVISFTKNAPALFVDKLWFIADAMFTVGMIGTVSGFLILAGDALGSINPADVASLQKTIQTIGTGIGTIAVTTLMGLISSLLLRLQLEIIDHLVTDKNA